jgi:nitrogenase molybdenum-cofactor synthesis protein NifE
MNSELQTQDIILPSIAKGNGSVLKDLFRDLVFNGIYQGTTWQLHRYGINCKLSGAVFAITEIQGALPLIHGSIGCAFHQRLTPRRMYAPIYHLPCTNLNEEDVIFGGEDKLREKIVETYKKYHPELIAILPTCVVGVTGDEAKWMMKDIQVPCDLIYIQSEGFAHRSRESLDVLMNTFTRTWTDPTTPPLYEIRGCGHEEAMCSLVDQLMEDQDIIENTINVEAFTRFNYGWKTEHKEMTRIFNDMGLSINMTFPKCTVDEVKRAPAAQLNIVRRGTRWAAQMRKEFGTDYIRKQFFYSGIDSIETFLRDVASKFDLAGEADEVIHRDKNIALQQLEEHSKAFKNSEFALFMRGFFSTPYLVRTYVLDLKIPLKYVCVDTQWLKGHNVSDKTIGDMIKTIEELFEKWDLDVEFVINPSLKKMREIAKRVDYVLDDHSISSLYEKEGIHMINTSIDNYLFGRIGFSGLVEFAAYLRQEMMRQRNPKKPIISMFDHDETYYPILADKMCRASHEMWSTMWGLRSG